VRLAANSGEGKGIASKGIRKVQRQETKEYKDAIRALRINPGNGFHRLEKMEAINQSDLFDRPDEVAKAYREAQFVCGEYRFR
jgi:hypothetical protein